MVAVNGVVFELVQGGRLQQSKHYATLIKSKMLVIFHFTELQMENST